MAIASPALGRTPAKLGIVSCPPDLARHLELDGGAVIYLVIPSSPAGKAKLQPGDVVTQLDGAPIASFAELSRRIQSLPAGKPVQVEYRRDGQQRTALVTLSAWTGDLTTDSHKAALEFLRKRSKDKPGPVLTREIVDRLWESGDRRGAVEELGRAIEQFPTNTSFQDHRLELLMKTGDYGRFVEEAERVSDKFPRSRELKLRKLDALLAVGRNEEAEKLSAELAAATTLFGLAPAEYTVEARKRWVLARLRLGKPVRSKDDPPALAGGWEHPELQVVQYWREQLGEKPPYALDSKETTAELDFERSGVLFGLAPYAMHGIKISINGVEVPLAIVDTGASHTLISTQTAQQAKVKVGTATRSAAGSLAFTARPGYVEEMRIGKITLKNLPVTVGNPPPMVMTKAKVALGVDVMHHLRFTIDYLTNKVVVATADEPSPETKHKAWDIPLWTFPDHCLSQGKLADGSFARTLIDSGNFATTLVWPPWAKQHIPNHPGQTGSMFLYAFSNPQHKIRGLELGGRTLPEWPALDMPPVTLQGVDLLDLLMGHDLLSQYRVTIDMQERRLRLESPGKDAGPPIAPKPMIL